MDKVGSIFLTGEAQRGHRFCTPLKWCFVKCNKTPLNRVPLCVCLMKSDYPLYPFYVAIFLCNINIRACVNEWNAFMRPRVSASECAWGVSARLCVREWVRACVVRGWVRFGVSACVCVRDRWLLCSYRFQHHDQIGNNAIGHGDVVGDDRDDFECRLTNDRIGQ